MIQRWQDRCRLYLAGLVLAVLVCGAGLATGCIGSKTTECSWGKVCPANQVCDEIHSLCVYPAQLDQCAEKQNTHPCVFPGADPGTFMCQDEVCLPKATCGNGLVEQNESCDSMALGTDGDLTCVDLPGGFTGGVLQCDSECALDTHRCTTCGDARCEPDETVDSCPVDCGVQDISAGFAHTCIVLSDGTARCWGTAEDGQLGNLDGDEAFTPQPVYGITTAARISAGGGVTCILLQDGHVRCAGDNEDGALGDGLTEHYDCGGYDCGPAPVSVAGLDTATLISAGSWHACALLADTNLRCWGDNEVGQLGDGTTADRYTPTPVFGLTSAVGVTAGAAHSCAVLADGTVRCWGENVEGSLGNLDGESSWIPVAVDAVADAVAVDAGELHTCALLEDGRIRCWGHNYFGQRGDGGDISSLTATWVVGIDTAVALAVGDRHACALLTNGTVRCWGGNGSGQLGNGTSDVALLPVTVGGLANVQAITAGGAHTCALSVGNELWCWGTNEWGQLGNGTWADSNVPTRVQSWSGAREFEL